MTDQTTYASYCRGFTKLSIWYARKRILEGTSDFENALNERVNIFRNTSLFKDGKHPAQGDVIPEWNALLEKVEKIFDRHIADDDTTELEQQSLDVFWPVLEERVKSHKRWTPTFEQRPYEAWSFDYRSDDRMNIHIANTYAPNSPLSEKRVQFAAALIRLLEDSQKNRPDIEIVACGSWLNSLPTFLDLFTDAWKTSGTAGRNVGYKLGHWGQFMDRHGDFHARNGAKFRALNEFPYTSLSCRDRIDSTLEHLRLSFPEAVEHNQSVHNR
jgi:hypothetical protein